MATIEELKIALINADKAGDSDAARKLAAVIQREQSKIVPSRPDAQVEIPQQANTPTMAEQAIGAGETALALGTGATGGSIGYIGGVLQGLAQQILSGNFGTPQAAEAVKASAEEGAQAFTYQPRTQAGQQITEATSQALEPLQALAPAAVELGAVTSGLKNAPRATQAQRAIIEEPQTISPRATQAQELPVPINLTEGQKTRQFAQQQFEREIAKQPELGQPLRERFADQNEAIIKNFDTFIDASGSELSDLRATGTAVDKALRERAMKDKNKIKIAYTNAEKAGEMEAPTTLESVIQHINESAPEAEVSNVLKAARQKALQLGIAVEDGNGNLIPQPTTLKNAEIFRRSISAATNAEPTNIRQSTIMKGLIDESTSGIGGELYKNARELRTKYANDYENAGLVRDLIGKKRGTEDRKIAIEDVFQKSILNASTDEVNNVKRLLLTGEEGGSQAWKELQGATLRYIKDEATKNVARDERGNPLVSASQLDRILKGLDKGGKLEEIFGKKGANQLRIINDVSKDVLVAVPNSVNSSNTAATILAGLDIALSGTMGVPAPIMSGLRLLANRVKDQKVKMRVKKALGEIQGEKK